jgi:hypothetical protein
VEVSATCRVVDGVAAEEKHRPGAGRSEAQCGTLKGVTTDCRVKENVPVSISGIPAISDGNGGIEIDTNSADSPYVTVYAAPLRTEHTDYTTLGQVADTTGQHD